MMVNQFPCESLLTVKDCLSAVARRVKGGLSPDWLPETFNLQTELPQFIRNYQQRQQRWESLSLFLFCFFSVQVDKPPEDGLLLRCVACSLTFAVCLRVLCIYFQRRGQPLDL